MAELTDDCLRNSVIGYVGRSPAARLLRRSSAIGGAVFGGGPDGVQRLLAGAAVETLGYRGAQRGQPVLLRLVAPDQIADIFAVVGIFAAGDLGLDPDVLALAQDDGLADGGHRGRSLRWSRHIIGAARGCKDGWAGATGTIPRPHA